MLERWRTVINSHSEHDMDERILRVMTESGVLAAPRGNTLYDALDIESVQQADLVLALLRVNTTPALAFAAALVGKPITRCPTAAARAMPPRATRPRTGDDRRVTMVARNPYLPTTDKFQRFRVVRPGLSVLQLLMRGVERRDLRRAEKLGHLWIEGREPEWLS